MESRRGIDRRGTMKIDCKGGNFAVENDFSKGSVVGNIVRLAVPMTLAQLVNVLYNIVDRVYIGKLPEDAMLALSGVGLCLPIISAVMAFANLYGSGGAPLCSIERGKGNADEAERIMGNSFALLLLTGVGLTAFGLLAKRPMLYLFGASEQTFPFADSYITIYLLGNLFVMIGLGMNSFINAQGFARVGMVSVLLGAGSNIILDPIFIFALGMGVRGAATATVISQFLSAVWILRFLTGKRAILRLRRENLRLDAGHVMRIVGLGLSGFTMSITNAIVQVVCNANLQIFGGDLYVGVMTVVNSVREVISLPVNGMTQSAQPVIGYNYGAGQYQRVKRAIAFVSIAAISYTTAMWVLVHTFPAFFIRVFNDDPAMLSAGVTAMRVYYFGFFAMSLQFAAQSVFVALGKAKQAIFFSIFRKVVIVTPLVFLLPRVAGLGTTGVFLSEPVSNFIGGAACFGTMLWTVKRELQDGT